MVEALLISISFIIGIAAVFTIIARSIKQPPIIAYLIAGVVVGPLVLGIIGQTAESSDLMQTFARLGVALLLFIVGLNLDFRVLKEFGKVATLTGIGEVTATALVGFFIVLGLGFKFIPALYLAAALAFSSTVVVVKILSDKKEIDTLHGRIALGILIVEDFIAAIVLMLIPVLQSGQLIGIVYGVAKIVILIGATFAISIFVLDKFIHYLARNQETLFLFGIAWALIFAAMFSYFGLSLEIGALIAGMSLAASKYNLELGGKIKPLRDFFVVLLFVFFGSQLAGPISLTLIKEAAILSLFILIGKPLIVMSFMKLFGYKKRTIFLTGSSLAQLSELSLILVLLGFTAGYLNQEIMNLAVLISLFTIGISSYSIYYSHSIFNKISRLLFMFENKGGKDAIDKQKEKEYEIVLFGHHRIGFKIIETLKKMKTPFVVVDYNPKVIMSLTKSGIDCIYGDAADKDFLSELNLEKVKLVISTVPGEEANLVIKERLNEINSKAAFLATAEQPRAAMDLYKEGIDYVIIPHHLGGDYVANMIENYGLHKHKYNSEGKLHAHELKKRKDSSTYD